MSLTQEDLQQIEAIFDRKLEPVLGELKALREDIKESTVWLQFCKQAQLPIMNLAEQQPPWPGAGRPQEYNICFDQIAFLC